MVGVVLLIIALIVLVCMLQCSKPHRHHRLCGCTRMYKEGFTANHNDYVNAYGLDQSIIDSHRRFIDDAQFHTTTASTDTVFSHDLDPTGNGWVGLRRPEYKVDVDVNARSVSSVDENQLPINQRFDRTGAYGNLI